ncbi:MAG: N-acetylglucosamine-6-phosphate deacetylase [Terriglobia bacterium]
MNRLALFTKQVVTPERVIPQGVILVEGSRILEVNSRFSIHFDDREFEVFHCENLTLVPGFIDIHIHGADGRDIMEGTKEAVDAISGFLVRHGTTAYLATTVTASPYATLQAIESLGKLIPGGAGGARVLGLHLEGPFINEKKRGVHPSEFIRHPSTPTLDEFIKWSNNQIKLVTMAPEVPGGIDFIRHARSAGIKVSIGHSEATLMEAREAIAAGVTNATHTFNAMREFNHREPGLLGAVLNEERVWAEFIADGVHVDPSVLEILLRCKGTRRLVLVTDAISACGKPDGEYQVGPLRVQVNQGVCRTNDGRLAGSTLTQDRALQNMMRWTKVSLAEAAFMASRNPAESIGIASQKGSIEPGLDADLVLLDDELNVQMTFCEGRLSYRRHQAGL